ncbi:MAG TPA: alanine racemase [Paenalcaligenes sp.]|nr:alanine racemase [Paenalcaligenes sp.]
MPRPIQLLLSSAALTHNLAVVRQRLTEASTRLQRPAPHIWAVIKANAYGHGIDLGVQAFAQADGLAMLDFNEAIRCRELGWDKPILLLEGFFSADDLDLVTRHNLSIVVHDASQLQALYQLQPPQPISAYLKINTGMHRLGFAGSAVDAAWREIRALQQQGVLRFLGAMTHFSRADSSEADTLAQIERFQQLNPAPVAPFSVCNSAATLQTGLQSHLPAIEQWVRPGICLYGASPFETQSAADFDLRPAQTLSAEIIGVQHVQAGDGVGYGHIFEAERTLRVGVVACGYADGYPRHAPSGTPATVDGQRTRLVGRVSMDMLTVDITDLPDAGVGSQVILWGAGGPSVDEVAQSAGTIGYELVTAVTARVPRVVEFSNTTRQEDNDEK